MAAHLTLLMRGESVIPYCRRRTRCRTQIRAEDQCEISQRNFNGEAICLPGSRPGCHYIESRRFRRGEVYREREIDM